MEVLLDQFDLADAVAVFESTVIGNETFYIDEVELDELGYALIRLNRIEEAVAVFGVGLKVFPVVILGGLDSIGGAILGGIIIGLLETFTAGVYPPLREIVPYIVLILILMVKPYGLFGLVEIERV